jgi:hypothetical protein
VGAVDRELVRSIKQFGVDVISLNQFAEMVAATPRTFCAFEVEHIEFADDVAENNGAVTRYDSASQFSRDNGAAAMSSAA